MAGRDRAVAAVGRYRPQVAIGLPLLRKQRARRDLEWHSRWTSSKIIRFSQLQRLRAIYIDCGDQGVVLHWYARTLAARIAGRGIAVRPKEFDDGPVTYQYDISPHSSLRWFSRPAD